MSTSSYVSSTTSSNRNLSSFVIDSALGATSAAAAAAPATSDAPLKVVVANSDYWSQNSGALSFKRGEHFEVLDDSEGPWWKARSYVTKQTGYIPSELVGPVGAT